MKTMLFIAAALFLLSTVVGMPGHGAAGTVEEVKKEKNTTKTQ